MEQINYGKKTIEYYIKRSKRKKTLAVNITPMAQVVVLAPDCLSKEKIEGVVRRKARWILEKQEYFKELLLLFPEKEFVSGEQILFLGRRYRLKIKGREKESSSLLELVGRRIFIKVEQNIDARQRKETIKDALIKWYFSQSEKVIKQRINQYGKQLRIFPCKIQIKDQKTRWGSCSSDGTVRFNWRIAMAPISIIDYIIVHELCHLKIKNHSPEFWRLVSLALPDYQKRREWLKNNAGIFRI